MAANKGLKRLKLYCGMVDVSMCCEKFIAKSLLQLECLSLMYNLKNYVSFERLAQLKELREIEVNFKGAFENVHLLLLDCTKLQKIQLEHTLIHKVDKDVLKKLGRALIDYANRHPKRPITVIGLDPIYVHIRPSNLIIFKVPMNFKTL